ncbi:class I ribonucleotide reductase maintenance protein YfaE [Ferrimonas sediminum]|uniref:class I ribonucleotide reductase maintenance protein YfaE n=1 Tax=Ferrimonas sediminum TaxID=718193 RepID=UPI000B035216
MKLWKIRLGGGRELEHGNHHTTLLHALESVGHYSECRSGFCGACKATLVSGSVRYLTTPMAFLKPGEILPCCCTPETDLELNLG